MIMGTERKNKKEKTDNSDYIKTDNVPMRNETK